MFKRKVQELEDTKYSSLEFSCDLDSAKFTEREVLIMGKGWIKDKRVLSIKTKIKKSFTRDSHTVTYHFVCADEDTMLEDFDNVQEVIDANVEVKIEAMTTSLSNKVFNQVADMKNFIDEKL